MTAHGTRVKGAAVNTAKLNPDDVRAIRFTHDGGFNFAEIGREYGVSAENVSAIVRWITWKSVTSS